MTKLGNRGKNRTKRFHRKDYLVLEHINYLLARKYDHEFLAQNSSEGERNMAQHHSAKRSSPVFAAFLFYRTFISHPIRIGRALHNKTKN